jgi:hypothetical protein
MTVRIITACVSFIETADDDLYPLLRPGRLELAQKPLHVASWTSDDPLLLAVDATP